MAAGHGLIALTFVVGVSSGCARITSEVARQATPDVVESGLETATTPASKEKIQQLVSETPVKASVAEIDPAVVDTILSRLAAEVNQPHLDGITKAVTSSFVQEVTRPRGAQLSRAQDAFIEHTVVIAVRAAVAQIKRDLPNLIADVAKNEQVRSALSPIGKTAGEGAVHGAVETVTGGDSKAP